MFNSFTGEVRVRAEPFEALELELALVWSEFASSQVGHLHHEAAHLQLP